MKHLSLLLFVLVCYISPLLSQDFWEQLNFPDTAQIMTITVNDQGNIFVGTLWNKYSGGVYRSLNSGETWEFSGLNHRTISSFTIDKSGRIYAGSSNYVSNPGLYRSNDNGQTWDTVFINPIFSGNIVDIFTVGVDTIFVSIWGDTGMLIRSFDDGLTWGLINNTGDVAEYISDIKIDEYNNLYISMVAYWTDFGGVYLSSDFGETWEFTGLLNYSVRALEFNKYGDLFAGSGSGIFVKYHDDEGWTSIQTSLNVKEIKLNDDGDIFFGCDDYNGIIRSIDNGQSFEYYNTGFDDPWIGDMAMDSSGYLIASKYLSNLLYRTIHSTLLTNIPSLPNETICKLSVYPNPTDNVLNINGFHGHEKPVAYKINIFNSLGRLLLTLDKTISTDQLYIDVSGFNEGFYFVEIINSNFKRTFTFVKK